MIDYEEKFVRLEPGVTYDVAVYLFPNGMVAVCELTTGFQVPELQGSKGKNSIIQAVNKGMIKVKELKE